jgi:hypothetical protein
MGFTTKTMRSQNLTLSRAIAATMRLNQGSTGLAGHRGPAHSHLLGRSATSGHAAPLKFITDRLEFRLFLGFATPSCL